ncbi:hypothetical protein VTN77DRAFT_193 [Rasamsonia byssochlamydoides]|uniref:uncharacterized protein n=1 Tax=Rasamsonia byssochlamydoides TaxID=89139 RepID=UPI00374413A0
MSEHNGGPDPPPAGRVAQPAASSVNGASSQHLPDSPHSLLTEQYNSTPIQPKPQSPSDVQNKNSKIPQIPKLSPATTELLARINGNKTTDVKREGAPATSSTGLNFSPFVRPVSENSDIEMNNKSKMKMSSAILELPAAPFSNHGAATAVPAAAPKAPVPPSQHPIVPGLVNIAPKPVEKPDQSATVAPQPPAGTSVAPSPASQQKTATPRQRKNGTNGAKRGKKRRRNEDSDDDNVRADDSSSDESSNFTPIATQTKSGRQVHRPSLFVPPPAPPPAPKPKAHSPDAPKGAATDGAASRKRRKVYRKGKEVNIVCAHCQRGHSPSTNMIVFCDGCNGSWHQFCHDPPIEKEVIEVKEAEWFCRECRPVESSVEEVSQKSQSSDQMIAPVHQDSQIAAKLPEARVGGEMFSAEERRGYLSGLSHAALVDLLVDLSDRNPTLPIFPPNLKDLKQSKFFSPFTSTMVSAHSGPSPAVAPANTQNEGPSDMPATKNDASSAPAPGTTSQSRRRRDDDSDDSGSEYEIEEHRLYPRAGNGFRLPPETEDFDMLLDDPACPTFSYQLHGYCNESAKTTGVVSVGGAA